ncbi:hybrid sensor histidine kinase/response regulator [Melittangium boletus]|uniref:histidine kinase n=1 Tax=Melittangium boletus DSM 14713 TaxID=1294270 RepID=A0A250IRK2_9BACT|nr:PAS domain-containing protein [Melittangium boletus]ATB33566.1 hybrid sensor histidine kinase/response regulator [Melittangium boletus DSM 14713]
MANIDEERYRLAARATNDAIWDWDLLSNHVQWNEALHASYGHVLADVEPTGEWWIHHIHPEDRARIDASIHAVIDGGGENWKDEYRFLRADGTYAHVLDRGFVARDPDGRALRMIGAMLDLSARKQAEQSLRDSEDRLRMATAATRLGTFDFHLRKQELIWDARCKELFGLSPDAPVTYETAFLQGIHPDDRGAADHAVQRALDPNGPGTYDLEYRTVGIEDGIERWVSAKGRTYFENGVAVRLIGTVLDISESKRNERALRELNATLEQRIAERTAERDRIWRTSSDLMGVVDFQGHLRSHNPAWSSLLGFSEDVLRSLFLVDILHPEDQTASLEAFQRLTRGERLGRLEQRLRCADGSWKTISWTASASEDAFYVIGHDVTEQRATEEALRQAQKMEAVGQLTAGIAHDFNNLLAGIMGGLELMRMRIARGQVNELDRYMNAVTQSITRAAALTHRLLAFSRRQSLDIKPADVNDIIASMEELIRRTLGENISSTRLLGKGLWRATTDRNQLENAILNLVINARDAMPGGGALTIETKNTHLDLAYTRDKDDLRPGDYVVIGVSDTGIGMSPEVIARAFDPFFTTKPIGQGTGLGLSMVYGFMKQTGGHVRIHSQVGRGTTFNLYLPRHQAETETVSPAPAERPRAEAGETVLVVEDDATVRMVMLDVLDDLGYGALEAVDAQTAIPFLEGDQRIDLLVTDVGLPGMNGRQLAEVARGNRPELPVLFVTGYAQGAAVRSGFLEAGMEMLTKPFTVDQLAVKIREMIERK